MRCAGVTRSFSGWKLYPSPPSAGSEALVNGRQPSGLEGSRMKVEVVGYVWISWLNAAILGSLPVFGRFDLPTQGVPAGTDLQGESTMVPAGTVPLPWL